MLASRTGRPRRACGTRPGHRPTALALLVSLRSHLLLLSLTFGGDKQGLPGFIAPWRDRRIEVPDLRIVLVPAPVSPAWSSALWRTFERAHGSCGLRRFSSKGGTLTLPSLDAAQLWRVIGCGRQEIGTSRHPGRHHVPDAWATTTVAWSPLRKTKNSRHANLCTPHTSVR